MTILGIDLGTANTVAAYRKPDETTTHIILPHEGPPIQGKVFPSYVEFNPAGKPINVARRAWENYGGSNKGIIVWGCKRLIGLSYNEAKTELRHFDYPIKKAADGSVIIIAGDDNYTPIQIATLIIQKVKRDAEDVEINSAIGDIEKVIVSHPANFDQDRVKATRDAVGAVFTNVDVDTVAEPVAAALAYAVKLPPKESKIVCVIDWGAGTLDVVTAILTMGADGKITMNPDPARGKANLGGIDMDDIIIDYLIEKHELTALAELRKGKEPNRNPSSIERLKEELKDLRRVTEMTKIRLNRKPARAQETFQTRYDGKVIKMTLDNKLIEEILEAPLDIDFLTEILEETVTKQKVSEMNKILDNISARKGRKDNPSFLDIFRLIILNSLKQSNYKPEDVDHVLLVGGPMNIACVRRAVKDIFEQNTKGVKQELDKIDKEGFVVDPMECVARGAALYSGGIRRLGYDYVVPLYRFWAEDKTHFVYDKKLLTIGKPIPTKNSCERDYPLGIDTELGTVDISLLEGAPPPIVPTEDTGKRIWRKKGGYNFYPTPNQEGRLQYTIALQAEIDGIKCTCHDHVAQKSYDYKRLDLLDGELLDEEKFVVEATGKKREVIKLPKEQVTQIELNAKRVLTLADRWLSPNQNHDAEEEKNRPGILKKKGLLEAALEKAPDESVVAWKETEDEEQYTDDKEVVNAWTLVYSLSVSLDAIFIKRDHYNVTNNDLKQLRSQASWLFQEISTKNAVLGQDKNIKDVARRLEEALGRLPEELQHDPSVNKEDLANYLEARNLTQALKSAIDTANSVSGTRPIKT